MRHKAPVEDGPGNQVDYFVVGHVIAQFPAGSGTRDDALDHLGPLLGESSMQLEHLRIAFGGIDQ
jgi:hypothetical protein